MAQSTFIAKKGHDADFAALTVDSLTINTATISAGAVVLADDEKITFGTGLDVTAEWDTAATPDELQFVPVADDTVIGFGKSAATQLSFDIRWLANESNGASSLFFDASANLVYTTGVDLQFKDADMLVFGTGAGGTGDVQLRWDATDLDLLPTANDSIFCIGNGTLCFDVKIFGKTTADYFTFDAGTSSLLVVGDARLDFSGCTVLAANTDGGVIKGGTSVAKITEDTASMKFISFYFDDGATSGTAVGDYVRLDVTGAAGSGVAMRPYVVVDTVAAATVHALQATASFAGGGTVTGIAQAIYANIMLPTEAVSGTLAAATFEVFSENTASDPAGSTLSVIHISNAGNADGMADVDTDAFAFNFTGWTEGDGNMIAVKAAAACPNVTESIRIKTPAGTRYIYVGSSALTA